jgi:hypothetical protein
MHSHMNVKFLLILTAVYVLNFHFQSIMPVLKCDSTKIFQNIHYSINFNLEQFYINNYNVFHIDAYQCTLCVCKECEYVKNFLLRVTTQKCLKSILFVTDSTGCTYNCRRL